MLKRILYATAVIFSVSIPLSGAPRVLYFNSYHIGYPWSDDTMRGMREVLDAHGVSLYIEFLDTKRFPEQFHEERYVEYVEHKYVDVQPDILVASDNAAYSFLRNNRETLFPGVPIVFNGVNYSSYADIESLPDFFGIDERPDIRANLDLILRVSPAIRHIAYVTDSSVSGRIVRDHMHEVLDEYALRLDFISLADMYPIQLVSRVNTLPKNTAIFFTFYNQDPGGNYYRFDEVLDMLSEYTTLPVWGAWDFLLGEGIIGGKMISGYHLGRQTGELIMKVLSGEPPTGRDRLQASPNGFIFDYRQLSRFGIDPERLPSKSEFINRPDTLVQRYRSLLIGSGGVIVGLIVIALYLAAANRRIRFMQNALRRSERNYRGIFENIEEGIFQADLEGHIESANPAFLRFIGAQTVESITGAPLSRYIGEEYSIRELLMRLKQEGRVSNLEFRIGPEEGTGLLVLLSARIVEVEIPGDSSPDYIEGSIYDISSLRHTEDKLRIINQELEKRVAERTAELAASVKQLENAQAQLVEAEKLSALGTLVAGIAHELNTPMGVAITGASYLTRKLDEAQGLSEDPAWNRRQFNQILPGLQESACIVLRNLERAGNLVRSFKEVAVDQVAGDTREYNLCELLRNVVVSLNPRVQESDAEIVLTCPDFITLHGDPGKMIQIVTNLIVNALMHGLPDSELRRVTITARVQDAFVELTISDTGRGIPEEHLNHIFEPFWTTARGRGGTGLGLHIVYNIVTSHPGGTIVCRSTPDVGTEFKISLPVVAEPESTSH